MSNRYFAAAKERRYDDMAKAMHPDALRRFKGMMLPLFEEAARQGQERQLQALFGGKTADELKKADDRQFFLAFFLGLFQRSPEMQGLLERADLEILGHVMEGKETAHVVYRMNTSTGPAKVTKMSVISLGRTDEGWAVLLTGEVEGMAALLKSRFKGTNP